MTTSPQEPQPTDGRVAEAIPHAGIPGIELPHAEQSGELRDIIPHDENLASVIPDSPASISESPASTPLAPPESNPITASVASAEKKSRKGLIAGGVGAAAGAAVLAAVLAFGSGGGDSSPKKTSQPSEQSAPNPNKNANKYGVTSEDGIKSAVSSWKVDGKAYVPGNPNPAVNFSESYNLAPGENEFRTKTAADWQTMLGKISSEQASGLGTETVHYLSGTTLLLEIDGQIAEVNNPVVYGWNSVDGVAYFGANASNPNYDKYIVFYPNQSGGWDELSILSEGVGSPSHPGTLLVGAFQKGKDLFSPIQIRSGSPSLNGLELVFPAAPGGAETTSTVLHTENMDSVVRNFLKEHQDYVPIYSLFDVHEKIQK